jgi:hypothetical protein
MEAIEFINRYPIYIARIEKIAKPEFKEALTRLQDFDPHDIVKPEHYLNSEAEAIGVVLQLFFRKIKEVEDEKA